VLAEAAAWRRKPMSRDPSTTGDHDTTLGYWVDAPGRGALRATPLPPLGPADVELAAVCTGVSPGTERLVGTGRVPMAAEATMRVPGMQGTFALPVLYGYSFVGEVVTGPGRGRLVFTMHPHTQRARVALANCVDVPAGVPAPRATLFPNLETAQNAVWDAELTGDERVLVLGAGAVGLLVAHVLAHGHRGAVVVCDRDPARREHAARLPWVTTVGDPAHLPTAGFDVVFDATGAAAGLQTAIDACAFEGRVIELSWYGDQPVALQLGGAFHWRRLRIVGSQVGTVARSRRAGGREVRTAAVLALLADPHLDRLCTPVAWAAAPELFASLYRGTAVPLLPVLDHRPQP
jgi:hypothetical protein